MAENIINGLFEGQATKALLGPDVQAAVAEGCGGDEI